MQPGDHADSDPERIALVVVGQGGGRSYRQLEDRSRRAAQLLARAGLRAGQVVALLMGNEAELLEICWGARRSGLYYCAIGTHLRPQEVAYVLSDCGAQALFASASVGGLAAQASYLAAQAGDGTRDLLRVACGGGIAGFESYEELLEGVPPLRLAGETEGTDLLYSSGTTGRPKGVRHELSGAPYGTPDGLCVIAAGLYGMDATSVYLSPAPLYHAAPLRFCMAAQRLGATVAVMERFDPEGFLAAVGRWRVTHAQLVPTMMVRLSKLPPAVWDRHDLSSLRCLVHASAPCPVPLKHEMIRRFGPILHEYYAGTEANGFVAIDTPTWLEHPGSVGRPVIGVVHVLDEDGAELAAGQRGVVYFEGGPSFAYHNDAAKTSASHDRRGWSTLGDVGHLDGDGFLFLTDRLAFTIVSGGVNVYPREAEDVLVTHPAVADAAVFGIPDEDLGEQVKAVVEPLEWPPGAAGASELEEALISWCRSRLAAYKCPRSIDLVRALPRLPTGKLAKRALQDPYWPRRDRRVN
ncbi:MAG: acyl-CoA synthetase [Acidimicrobiales bacterium]